MGDERNPTEDHVRALQGESNNAADALQTSNEQYGRFNEHFKPDNAQIDSSSASSDPVL